MVRLFILRFSIMVWKIAINVSDAFKPSTWKKIAIVQAVLAALFFCMYGVQVADEPSIPPLFAQLDLPAPPISTSTQGFDYAISPDNLIAYAKATSGARTVGIRTFEWSTSEMRSSIGFSSIYSTGLKNCADCDVVLLTVSSSPQNGGVYLSESASSKRLVSLGGWDVAALYRYSRQAVPQRSLLDTAQRILTLVQALSLTSGSIFATLFGWVAYHRGKAELKLKQLQIREIEARLNQMERDRQRQLDEAAKSCIILVSG
jgi:hypothetical protein